MCVCGVWWKLGKKVNMGSDVWGAWRGWCHFLLRVLCKRCVGVEKVDAGADDMESSNACLIAVALLLQLVAWGGEVLGAWGT